jgi:hypothetical protein
MNQIIPTLPSSHILCTAKTDSEADMMRRSLPSTPRSAGFDTATTPFVFDDGFLSFYTASPSSSDDSASDFSPPSSSSTSSYSDCFLDSPLPASLQRLAIWRQGSEATPHLYADSSRNPRISGTVSLKHLDPLSMRYGSVHTTISQLFCPFLHLLIPLVVPSTGVAKGLSLTKSIVTISTPSKSPVRLMISTYNRGTLTFQSEVDMTEEMPTFLGDTRYSAPLPQEFIDEVCQGVDCSHPESSDVLDSIAVMRFIQQTDSAHGPYGRTILGLVCDFQTHMGPFPSQVKLSHLSSKIRKSQSVDPLPILPPSGEDQPDLKQPAPGFQASAQQRSPGRVFPKLSVSIPPPSARMSTPRGHTQVYSDSLNASPDRATPLTGVPQSVHPATPFDQLVHTPLHQPEQSHSTARNYGGYRPSSTENTYRLTLSTASPSTAQFPAMDLMIMPDSEESKRTRQQSQDLFRYSGPAQHGTTSSTRISCLPPRLCPDSP